MITDEIINKAFKAYIESDAWSRTERMRAALKAVAPLLIAQGRKEAENELLWGIRAKELDPK